MTASGGAGLLRVGLLRIDSALVALPVDVLREVVPRPAEWTPLPTAAPGLVGAMHLRESVLPVLDLGALTGSPRVGDAMGVVVLVHAGAALGLLVDGVHDVVDLPPEALQPATVRSADGVAPLMFSATFTRPGTGEIGSLLDPTAVLGWPGVLTTTLAGEGETFAGLVGAGGPGDDAGLVDAPPSPAQQAFLVVRCVPAEGTPVLVAVDVADVQTTLPTLTPRPSQLSSDLCVGVTDHGDVRIPVVDPLHLLGLPRPRPGAPSQALLIRSERGLLALMFAEALDIVRPAPGTLLPPPPGTGRGRAALTHVARMAVGHVLVLDAATLLADPEINALSALNTQASGPAPERGRRTGAGTTTAVPAADPVVVFRARGSLTAPLTHVDGVVTFPTDPAPWIGGRSGLGALVTDHDVVPLVDLAETLGRGGLPDPRQGVVLLVRVPTDPTGTTGPGPDAAPARVGFVVEGLSDIERPLWTEDLADADAEERSPLVRVGASTAPLLPLVDLQDLAASVHSPRRTRRLTPR